VQTAIEIQGLSKRFGAVHAVSDLDLTVAAGRVTGFLGPNGAGKSTTLRMLLGLIHPDKGTATFAGRTYRELAHASAHVGAVLEHASFHPGRTGRNHLRVLAAAGSHPPGRVDDVLDQVGMTDRADRRVKGYSMGMRQRLAIAAALLGDPEVLILDEPTNGLDPPGIRWVRDLVREQAGRGRAVLVSSHLLFEVAQSVDDVVVITEGTLRAAGPLDQVLGGGTEITLVRVTDADGPRLAQALDRRGWATARPVDEASPGAGAGAGVAGSDGRAPVADDLPAAPATADPAAPTAPSAPAAAVGVAGVGADGDGPALLVTGASPAAVGRVAADEGIALTELRAHTRSLEDAFLALTGGRS
jgi:ABC-2 type transport system ATP-binding protein